MTVVGIPGDPNLFRVQAAFEALDDLADQVVLVGGCATGLLVTSVRAEMIRATRDIVVVIEVVHQASYRRFESMLRDRGFINDQSKDAPICRWRHSDVILDVMPISEKVLGFGNRWYPLAFELSHAVQLPNGQPIRLVSAPIFLLTKFEAFRQRGYADPQFSHDLEDIVTVVDGRDELGAELEACPNEAKHAISKHCGNLLNDQSIVQVLQGFLPGDMASQARLPGLLDKLSHLAGRD